MTNRVPLIPVHTLLESLQALPDDAEISFSGLTFYRVKPRGNNVFQIEFNELVSRSPDGVLTVVDPESRI